jgi:uncharacterized protein
VAELLGRPGERRTVHTAERFGDLRLSSSWVESTDDVTVDVVLESVLGGRITVGGTVVARWKGECRRCLGPVAGDLQIEVREVYTEEASEDATDPDLLTFHGTDIDLEPVVREAVLLALPIAPLCREDCPGPDPEHAPVAADDSTDDVADPAPDPRWAALDELHFDE